MVDPYDSSNNQIAHVEAMVSQKGINSVEGTAPVNGELTLCHILLIRQRSWIQDGHFLFFQA